MPRARPRATIAILGCGSTGTAFAVALDALRPRLSLTVWSRSEASVARLLEAVRGAGGDPARIGIAGTAEAAVAAAGSALLCVSDAALPALARRLARGVPMARGGRVALAASGSVPLARLAALSTAGTAVGRLHPLLPLLPGSGAALENAPFGLEGEPRALRAARALVRRLRGLPLELVPRRGAAERYHAGAALLGGGLVALLDLAERAMAPSLRASRADLREALLVFVEEVATNARFEGPARALTGPLARGAAETVRVHLRALRGVPGAVDAYRALGATMLALARERGGLDADAERALAAVLAPRLTPRGAPR